MLDIRARPERRRLRCSLRLTMALGLAVLTAPLASAQPAKANKPGAAAKPAAPAAPTLQSLLADRDAEMVADLMDWRRKVLALPDDVVIDAALSEAVASLVKEHLGRVPAITQAWIADERAAARNPALTGGPLAQALYLRALNEMAIAGVESLDAASDEAWLAAALAPRACQQLSPWPFGRQIAMIQAAPVELRPALLAAVKEQLARWGKPRKALPERPSASSGAAARRRPTRNARHWPSSCSGTPRRRPSRRAAF